MKKTFTEKDLSFLRSIKFDVKSKLEMEDIDENSHFFLSSILKMEEIGKKYLDYENVDEILKIHGPDLQESKDLIIRFMSKLQEHLKK